MLIRHFIGGTLNKTCSPTLNDISIHCNLHSHCFYFEFPITWFRYPSPCSKLPLSSQCIEVTPQMLQTTQWEIYISHIVSQRMLSLYWNDKYFCMRTQTMVRNYPNCGNWIKLLQRLRKIHHEVHGYYFLLILKNGHFLKKTM